MEDGMQHFHEWYNGKMATHKDTAVPVRSP